jgi:hypothetical protein
MGLAEHVRAGARLTRDVVIINDVSGSGSINLGATYTLINIQSNQNCRFRLYDNQSSRDNATEINRTFGNTNVPAPIALIGDFSMSAGQNYSIDPVLFGHADNFNNPLSYYRVSPSSSIIQVTRFLLENNNFPPRVGTAYTEDNRRRLSTITGTSLGPNDIQSGVLTTVGDTIPKTYMLVSASLQDATQIARLRLYSISGSVNDASEQSRIFSVEPSSSVRLIADMILSGSETTYFSPKIIGVNTENLSNDLNDIRNTEQINGLNEIYYIIQNVSSSGLPVTINAKLYVYALED